MKTAKKAIAVSLVTLAMVSGMATPVLASEFQSNFSQASVTPRIVHTKYISDYPVFYSNYSDIPSTYSYYQWSSEDGAYFSGTLDLYSIVKTSGGWIAHYRGNVVGTI